MIANIIGLLCISLGIFFSILIIVKSYKDVVKRNKPACFGCAGCTGFTGCKSCKKIVKIVQQSKNL